jgi:hypothetical protein
LCEAPASQFVSFRRLIALQERRITLFIRTKTLHKLFDITQLVKKMVSSEKKKLDNKEFK